MKYINTHTHTHTQTDISGEHSPTQSGMLITVSFHLPFLHSIVLFLSLLSGNTLPVLHRNVREVSVLFDT